MKNGKYMKKRALNVKALALVLTLSLLVCGAIGGTIAWLADETDEVKNTFTSSDVDIDLAETTGNSYKMIPGATINKDPKVTVSEDSEECYVFLKVEENTVTVGTGENAKTYTVDSFLDYSIESGWTQLPGVEGVYYRDGKANDSFDVLAGNQVTVKTEVTRDMMQDIKVTQPTLTFTAYAIQKANLNITDMAEIWDLANGD